MKVQMKIVLMLLTYIILFSACSQKSLFDQKAGNLRLAIDNTGKITALEDIIKGTNYIAPDEASYLLECQKYGEDSNKIMFHPESMKIIEQTKSNTKIELTYKADVKLTVLITPRKDYFRMELINAYPVKDVSMISWGKYTTTMKGQIAEWLDMNRSDDFTIGLLTLEPHTDGIFSSYNQNGSSLQLFSYDNTRGQFIGAENEKLRKSVPFPGLTVIGSAVALFGCPTGKDNELNVIKEIELGENLPHPIFDGKWNKYSKEGQKFCVWGNYTEEDFEEYLNFSKEVGARILCRPGGFYKNWGHFDINPEIYPGGINAILANSEQAKKEGIGLTLYSLTTFLKPNPDKEPYLAPVPDERLQTWKAQSKLIKDISKKDKEIFLQNSEDIVATLNAASNKVIRIDDELIEFKKFSIKDNEIIAEDCERGQFYTTVKDHKKDSNIRLMYVSGYHNFYPGTLELSNEFSERLSETLIKADLDNFVVDGFESCLETGYGSFTGNVFLKNFYDRCVKKNKQVLVTGSCFTQYTWHIMSHISWGEGDWERGFRGSMLDYRISRQLQLKRNLMPRKLGQYYPDNATAEDVEWLMALAAGWDSGIDFHLNLKKIKKNPEYKKIIETLRLWQEAIADNAFTEEQKMALRQTDVLYKLSRKTGGGWDLKFDRFWQNEKINILPPSVMDAKAVNGGPESVKSCSIDWSWTHNPGLYNEVGLSDDLIHRSGTKTTSWTVSYPPFTESTKSWYPTSDRHFQFIIRLAKDAPCAVNHFRVSINNQVVEIPVVLQPGQYISIPHTLELACIYDENHKVVGEVYLHGYLPKVKKGTTATISLSCEPVDAKTNPVVILNVRFQNGYFL
jgi:hypothetical protein